MGLNHSPSIVIPGLVLCLDAANTQSYPGSGTVWTDVSGQGNNGTLVNAPTFSSANSGSIVFNGTNQYAAGSIPTINSWSMCLWYLSTDISSQAVFYPFSGTTTASGLGFGGTFDASTVNRWYFFDGTTASFSSPNTAVTTNVWYNLVVTKSSTTYSLYTNGTLSLNATGVDLSLTQYNLGRRGNGEWYAQGNIAQASIYNRALTADEVNQNFQALRGRFGI
jgi:Concanavalin A-like lectin/glucanases superfamily